MVILWNNTSLTDSCKRFITSRVFLINKGVIFKKDKTRLVKWRTFLISLHGHAIAGSPDILNG